MLAPIPYRGDRPVAFPTPPRIIPDPNRKSRGGPFRSPCRRWNILLWRMRRGGSEAESAPLEHRRVSRTELAVSPIVTRAHCLNPTPISYNAPSYEVSIPPPPSPIPGKTGKFPLKQSKITPESAHQSKIPTGTGPPIGPRRRTPYVRRPPRVDPTFPPNVYSVSLQPRISPSNIVEHRLGLDEKEYLSWHQE